MNKFLKNFLLVVTCALLLASCKTAVSSSDDTPAVTPAVTPAADAGAVAPVVGEISPLALATGVPLTADITAVFSAAMDATTITTTSFVVKAADVSIDGVVTLNDKTATFHPVASLAALTTYSVTILATVKDSAGTPMAASKEWSFTTGAVLDTTAPTIVSTIPVDLAAGVACTDAITVVFSEKMDPVTINASTITLKKGGILIAGALAYSGVTATFKPSVTLEGNTAYTVSVTSGAKDISGNALSADKSWSFNTVRGPAIVNLGTAGDFVILAEAGIDSIPTSVITGNIGVSPLAATYLTHFSLTMDGTGTFSTSGQVTGKVYAADYAAPTPAYLTTAVGDLLIADNDISGRLHPDFLDLGTGDISGQTLAPGLYKWNTGLTMNTDVTINGGPNDVWIFQVDGVLYMGANVKITLSGGAQAKNIFWKINSGLLNSKAHIEGNVISKTAINLSNGASINGRLLTHTAVNLDACTVTMPK